MTLARSPLALAAERAWADARIARRGAGANYGLQLASAAALRQLESHPNSNIRRLAGAVESCARAVGGDDGRAA